MSSENCVYRKPVKDAENCYKYLTAIKEFPFICNFVWSFINKAVYSFTSKKSNSWVSEFLLEMNKK